MDPTQEQRYHGVTCTKAGPHASQQQYFGLEREKENTTAGIGQVLKVESMMSFPTWLVPANRRQANQKHLFSLVYTCAALSRFSTQSKNMFNNQHKGGPFFFFNFHYVVAAVSFLLLHSRDLRRLYRLHRAARLLHNRFPL